MLPVLGRCLLHFNSIKPLFRLCDLHEGKPFKQSENLLIDFNISVPYHSDLPVVVIAIWYQLGEGACFGELWQNSPFKITLLVLLYFEFYILLRI